ncbi:MAG: FAD-dependent oxidoreductase [Erysipelothrix sp.]
MKIAVIGGGIVGSTTAFYLSENNDIDVTLFDEGVGQATSAAVGIICPWVSQRRNKEWYELVRDGAEFYHTLISDLEDDSFYYNSGTLIFHDTLLEKLEKIALDRLPDAPAMKSIKKLSESEVKALLPDGFTAKKALFVEGGSQIDGKQLVALLKDKATSNGIRFVEKKAVVTFEEGHYVIEGESFDGCVIATGAWINQTMDGLLFDVRPQKGQLIETKISITRDNFPVLMPKGEIDILVNKEGNVVVGASHENDKDFDLSFDERVIESLIQGAREWIPELTRNDVLSSRVGTRAHTSNFSPFYGPVSSYPHLYVASGLGSSGLTSGPYIGYILAKAFIEEMESWPLHPDEFRIQ